MCVRSDGEDAGGELPLQTESMNRQAMRNGQNKRMRGRNRKGQNPLTRIYESNGPDVRIRGTASHVAEKYIQLARDAQASGDPVAAENYFQHAEHYFRMIAAAQEQFRPAQPYFRQDGEPREEHFEAFADEQPNAPADGPAFGGREPQPYQSRDYPGREGQPFAAREQHYVARSTSPPHPPRAEQSGDTERLPAFITGNGPPSQAFQGYGQPQNGFEGQPDRFPLHRRRRRRHGPRGELGAPQQASAGSDDISPHPPSGAQRIE
jgi:hypothetical protein